MRRPYDIPVDQHRLAGLNKSARRMGYTEPQCFPFALRLGGGGVWIMSLPYSLKIYSNLIPNSTSRFRGKQV